MADLQDPTKRLEAYFDHNIIEVERKALEEEATHDPALGQRLRLHREALMAFELLGQDRMRQSLRAMYFNVREDRRRRRTRTLRSSSVATAFLAIAGFFFFFRPELPSLDSFSFTPEPEVQAVPVVNREEPPVRMEDQGSELDDVVDTYFHPYEISMKSGQNERINSLAQRLQVSYQNGHYEASIRGFRKILDANPKRTDALLGVGISYMAIDSLPQAAQAFAQIIYLNSDYKEEAQWYLALAYFKEGMLIQAIGLMEEIARKEGHFKQPDALAILEEIR